MLRVTLLKGPSRQDAAWYRRRDTRMALGVDFAKYILVDADVTLLEFYEYHHT